jgi:hypothetical protein
MKGTAVPVRKLSAKERKFLCHILNSQQDPQTPEATEESLPFFTREYAIMCLARYRDDQQRFIDNLIFKLN